MSVIQAVEEFLHTFKGRQSELYGFIIKTLNSYNPQYDDAIYMFETLTKNSSLTRFTHCEGQRLQDIIMSLKSQQYIPLIVKYSRHNVRNIDKAIIPRLTNQYLSYSKEVSDMKQARDSRNLVELSEVNFLKIYDLYDQIIKTLQVKLTPDTYITWLALFGGYSAPQLSFIKTLLSKIKDNNSSIKPSLIYDYVKSRMAGSGNMILIILDLKSDQSVYRRILAQFVRKLPQQNQPGLLFLNLFRDCIPAAGLDFMRQILMNMNGQVPLPGRQLQNIFTKFVKPQLTKNLNSPILLTKISSLLQIFSQAGVGSYTMEQLQLMDNNNKQLDNTGRIELKKLVKNLSDTSVGRKGTNKSYASPTKDMSLSSYLGSTRDTLQSPSKSPSKPQRVTFKKPEKPSDPYQIETISRTTKKVIEEDKIRRFQNKQFTGIPNIKNSCYMNSFLQNMFYCDDLANVLLKYSGNNAPLEIIRRLFWALKDRRPSSELEEIMRGLRKSIEIFNHEEQMDCMEFGQYILDLLSLEDSIKVTKYLKFSFHNHNTLNSIKWPESSTWSTLRPSSVLATTFLPRNKSERHTSISISKIPSILAHLKAFKTKYISPSSSSKCRSYNSNTIENPNFECEKCKEKFKYCQQKISGFTQLPKYLVVVLNRFTYDRTLQAKKKILDKIIIEDYLHFNNINSLRKLNSDARYKLNSFVIHQGKSAQSGHYFAFVRNPYYKSSNYWVELNDEDTFQQISTTQDLFSHLGQNLSDSMSNLCCRDLQCPYILIYELSTSGGGYY